MFLKFSSAPLATEKRHFFKKVPEKDHFHTSIQEKLAKNFHSPPKAAKFFLGPCQNLLRAGATIHKFHRQGAMIAF